MLKNFVDSTNKLVRSTRNKRIDIEDIIPNPNNNFSIENLEELKESIMLYGLKHNITVYDEDKNGNYMIQSGHRRFECIKQLQDDGLIDDEIDVIVIQPVSDSLQMKLDIVLGNAHRDMTTDDKLNIVEMLLDIWEEMTSEQRPNGKKRDWIAGFLGCSGRTAQEYINTFKNPDGVMGDDVDQAVVDDEEMKEENIYDYEKLTKELQATTNKLKKILANSDDNDLSDIVVGENSGKTAKIGDLIEAELHRLMSIVELAKQKS